MYKGYEGDKDILDELMEERIKRPVLIKVSEAWPLLQGKTRYGYVGICVFFREMMNGLVEQGKAKKIGYGTWEIIKPAK